MGKGRSTISIGGARVGWVFGVRKGVIQIVFIVGPGNHDKIIMLDFYNAT